MYRVGENSAKLKDAAEKKTRVWLAVAMNDILRKSHLSQRRRQLGWESISQRFPLWRFIDSRVFPSNG
jgi:hypothetical protein